MPEAADSERIAVWVREHGAAVRGYLRAILGRDDAVDDLFQEVFARAWQGRLRYEERGHARAYLLQIVDRAAVRPVSAVETGDDTRRRSVGDWRQVGTFERSGDERSQLGGEASFGRGARSTWSAAKTGTTIAVPRPTFVYRDRRHVGLPLEHGAQPLPAGPAIIARIFWGESAMSAEHDKLLDSLNRATAPAGGMADGLLGNVIRIAASDDAEVRELRQSWLALSHLIQEAEVIEEFDEGFDAVNLSEKDRVYDERAVGSDRKCTQNPTW